MFYMIGLGLADEKDITVKGLEAIRSCKKVFLESYTSMLILPENLEEFFGKEVIEADRDMVEKNPDDILEDGNAFLVVGDVFSATTHIDLYLRAKEKGLDIKVIHNTSILTAVGSVGLELYKYGKTTSLPYFEKGFRPSSPYDAIKMNRENKLHTLVLLDIKPKRKMTVNEALSQLLEIEEEKKEGVVTEETFAVGCARMGSDSQLIRYAKVKDLLKEDFGGPLHCLIFPGKLHFMEEKMLNLYK